MKAVLPIAWRFFWPSSVIGVMHGLGAFFTVLGLIVPHPDSIAPAILGLVLLIFPLAISGGGLLRMASGSKTLRLRPHGRLQVFAGATLVIIMLASIYAIVMGAQAANFPKVVLPAAATRLQSVVTLAGIAAATFSLSWIVIFMLSRVYGSFWQFLWIPLLSSSKFIRPPEWAGAATAILLCVAALAWCLFGLWYVKTADIKQPAFRPNTSLEEQPVLREAQLWLRVVVYLQGPLSVTRRAAEHVYAMGANAKASFVLGAMFSALLYLLWVFVAEVGSQKLAMSHIIFLCVFATAAGSCAWSITRNARSLWLRAGLDRSGLFYLAERLGLGCSFFTYFVGACAFGLISYLRYPMPFPTLLLHLLTQMLLMLCFFYLFLAQIRGWNFMDAVICIIAASGWVVVLVALSPMLRQSQKSSPEVMTMLNVCFALIVAALIFRELARRRWKSIDWMLVRPPKALRPPR
jgi:hypothetical protein